MKIKVKWIFTLVLISMNLNIVTDIVFSEDKLIKKGLIILFLLYYFYGISTLLDKISALYNRITNVSKVAPLSVLGYYKGIVLLLIYCVLYVVFLYTKDFPLIILGTLSLSFVYTDIFQVVYDLDGKKYYFDGHKNDVQEILSYEINNRTLILHLKNNKEVMITKKGMDKINNVLSQ